MGEPKATTESASSAPLIEVRSVSKSYCNTGPEEWALRDVTLSINHGEMVAIRGTSGSGKTTLLNLIGGLDRRFEGDVKVNGASRSHQTEQEISRSRNQDIGFIFQHFSLLDHLSALDNVILPAMLTHGHVKRQRARDFLRDPVARASDLLDRIGLAHKKSALPTTLSGGQKQEWRSLELSFLNHLYSSVMNQLEALILIPVSKLSSSLSH